MNQLQRIKQWVGTEADVVALWVTRYRKPLAGMVVLGLGAMFLWTHPVVETVEPGDVGVRINRVSGNLDVMPDGPVLVIPVVHELRRYTLRDQVYKPPESSQSSSTRSFQSLEGLPVGIDVMVRFALDVQRIDQVARSLPVEVGPQLIHPMVEGVLHRRLAQHTIRDIFSGKRAEIEREVENELRTLMAADGVVIRAVYFGHVDLPSEYQKGLEGLLAEELNAERMEHTLKKREKEVEERRLVADAEKAAREKAAEASAMEEVIAAKGRAEAMRHVLPFKEREIEQRRLEAEAQKVQRRTVAEGEAEARKIETAAEAEARRTLAEANAYRVEVTSKAQLATLAKESELLAQNPLLIQKTFAEKMSERLQVVIAPPSAANGFFAASLIGQPPAPRATPHNAQANVVNANHVHTQETSQVEEEMQ